MSLTLTSMLDADRQRAVANIREAAGRIWARPLHRYYTDHTVAHSERIIALMDGLTAGMMAVGDKQLAPTEIFVLLSAAYLHDIGMQNEKFAEGDPSALPSVAGQALDEIRAHHNEQTAEMIYRVFEDPANAFSIPLARDPGLVEAVALVAKGHRGVKLESDEYASIVHGGETLRLRLLAALLRFGDELDIDHRRVDWEMMKLIKLPLDSQLHWWKCHYVSGVSIVDEYIKIAYRVPQDRPDYEGLIVPLVETEIRAKLASLEEIFRANAIKVAIAKSDVRSMRLVQPMPAEVEAQARKGAEGGARSVERQVGQGDTRQRTRSKKQEAGGKRQEAGGKKQEAGGKKQEAGGTRQEAGGTRQKASGKKPETQAKKRKKSSAPAASTTVFDQRGQKVGKQINVAGNYVDRQEADGADESEWDTEAIRALLNAAFGDEDIVTLCFDRFRGVYEEFSSGMSKRDKIQRLMDHCLRHAQMDDLLAQVRQRNPNQYARYEAQLRK